MQRLRERTRSSRHHPSASPSARRRARRLEDKDGGESDNTESTGDGHGAGAVGDRGLGLASVGGAWGSDASASWCWGATGAGWVRGRRSVGGSGLRASISGSGLRSGLGASIGGSGLGGSAGRSLITASGAHILVSINTLLDSIRDTLGEGGGDGLDVVGDLGGQGSGKSLGGGLLGLEGLVGLGTGLGGDDLLLLGDESVDGVGDIRDQALDGGGQLESIDICKLSLALDSDDGVLGGGDDIIRCGLDLVNAATAVGVDGTIERLHLGGDVGDDTGDGLDIALDSWGSDDGAAEGQAQSQEGGGELHYEDCI